MKLSPIAQAIGHTTPRPLDAPTSTAASVPEFTPEEQRRGRAMRGNTLYYCCYGMYCDAGDHTKDCKYAGGVRAPGEVASTGGGKP